MERVIFILPSGSARPVGGHKVVFEYTNKLYALYISSLISSPSTLYCGIPIVSIINLKLSLTPRHLLLNINKKDKKIIYLNTIFLTLHLINRQH